MRPRAEPTTWSTWTTTAVDGVVTRRLQIGPSYMFTLREVPAPTAMQALSPEERLVPTPAEEIELFQERDAGWDWYRGWCVRCGDSATRCVSYDRTPLGYGVEEVVAELVCHACGACTRVEFDKDTS